MFGPYNFEPVILNLGYLALGLLSIVISNLSDASCAQYSVLDFSKGAQNMERTFEPGKMVGKTIAKWE